MAASVPRRSTLLILLVVAALLVGVAAGLAGLRLPDERPWVRDGLLNFVGLLAGLAFAVFCAARVLRIDAVSFRGSLPR